MKFIACLLALIWSSSLSAVRMVTAIDTHTFAGLVEGDYRLRIPFAEVTNSGTLLVGADIREQTASDQTRISIGIVRSTDGGRTFGRPQVVIPHTALSDWDRAMDATILVNRRNGQLFLFAHRITTRNIWERTHEVGDHGFDCVMVTSTDDGLTWSAPVSLRQLMGGFGSGVVSLFGGVGNGITMSDGTLVLPMQCKMATSYTGRPRGEVDESGRKMFNIQSGLLYSRDGGKTWQRSASLLPCYSSECNVVEYRRGQLLINSRGYVGRRRLFTTSDLGTTWQRAEADSALVEPGACQGSFRRVKLGRRHVALFVNPRDEKVRQNLTLYRTDDYRTFSPLYTLEKGKTYGYSSLTDDKKHVYVVLETDGSTIVTYTFDKRELRKARPIL